MGKKTDLVVSIKPVQLSLTEWSAHNNRGNVDASIVEDKNSDSQNDLLRQIAPPMLLSQEWTEPHNQSAR